MKKLLIIVPVIALIAAGCGSKTNQTTVENTKTESVNYSPTSTPDTGSMDLPKASSTTSVDLGVKVKVKVGEKTFTVKGSNFAFSPTEIKVKKGDKVKIIFQNTGGFHDFVIDELKVKTSQIQGGKSETLEFIADKTGTFEFYCSVGTHRQMGMKGSLIVE